MDWALAEVYESPHGKVRWDSFGEGETVVLNHGTPFSSFVWRDVANALSARHRVYLWDMPGYGTSEKFEGQDVSLAAQQEVFTGWLRHCGLDEPSVVAHDFGGAVSLRSALLDGVEYRRLALLDAVSIRPWGSEFFNLVNAHAEVFAALPPALHESLVRGYLATAAHREIRSNVLDRLVAPWLGEDGRPAFYRQIAQADERYTREVEDRYGDLDCPVLIGWGEEDTWIPPDRARELARRIPHARLEWIPRAGHLVQEDNPARVTALIMEFLAS